MPKFRLKQSDHNERGAWIDLTLTLYTASSDPVPAVCRVRLFLAHEAEHVNESDNRIALE